MGSWSAIHLQGLPRYIAVFRVKRRATVDFFTALEHRKQPLRFYRLGPIVLSFQ
jgi:hypothetical protein